MLYTPNYNLPIYEASDIANYLDTYNNTITEIDTAIHNVQTKAESGELHGEELDREIESLTSRVSALETSLSSTIENLSTLSITVSGHTDEIAKVKEDLLAQNTAVKTLSNNLADLGTRFTSFATGQEHFNNEISARVGNRFSRHINTVLRQVQAKNSTRQILPLKQDLKMMKISQNPTSCLSLCKQRQMRKKQVPYLIAHLQQPKGFTITP